MIRLVRYLIAPNGFRAGKKSLSRGFSTQRVFDFYLECVRDTRYPPKQLVAKEAMDLMIATKSTLIDISV